MSAVSHLDIGNLLLYLLIYRILISVISATNNLYNAIIYQRNYLFLIYTNISIIIKGIYNVLAAKVAVVHKNLFQINVDFSTMPQPGTHSVSKLINKGINADILSGEKYAEIALAGVESMHVVRYCHSAVAAEFNTSGHAGAIN